MSNTPQLTSEQAAAIHTRDASVALAAGAGCGKTFVLTERYLSHLEPGGDNALKPAALNELVAITFTEPAAREMRARIRSKIYARLQAAEASQTEYWLKLLRAIDNARVSTIHSFCASLLRTYAVELGLDPAFDILQQTDSAVLLSTVIDDSLRELLLQRDPYTVALVTLFDLAPLKQKIATFLPAYRSEEFLKWAEKNKKDLDTTSKELVQTWIVFYRSTLLPEAATTLVNSTASLEVQKLLTSFIPEKEKFLAARETILSLLPNLEKSQVLSSDLSELQGLLKVQGLCTKKDWPNAEDYELYKNSVKKLRDSIKKLISKEIDPDLANEAAQLGLKLLEVTRHVSDRYEQEKKKLGKLDFDDLMSQAHRLLTSPNAETIRAELSRGIQLLMVDEFQDTNQQQVDIVEALCGDSLKDGKLFFVGDFKQSIYRFRGAEPNVFHILREKMPLHGQLPLNKNFRSQAAPLKFINEFFIQLFGDKYEPLIPHRQQVAPLPAVELILLANNSEEKIKTADARKQEAKWIAKRIYQLIASGEPIVWEASAAETGEPAARPLKLGDIAVLFRSLSDVRYYEEAFRELGLDYYMVGGHAFYAQQEIFDVINLLRSISTTGDPVSLAGVLRSPFFSLEDETLYWLTENSGSLNRGLFASQLPEELTNIEKSKVQNAAKIITQLRQTKDLVSTTHLIRLALDLTGYDATLLTEFLGKRKLANLQKLLEYARSADRGGLLDLNGFIRQMSEFIVSQPKEPLAVTSPENADVIRLMTIHHSKGLEFPLVVLPDLNRKPNMQTASALFDRKLGPLVNPPEKIDSLTGYDLFKQINTLEETEERKRLLYVAMTRTADYLMMSSSFVDALKIQSGSWLELLFQNNQQIRDYFERMRESNEEELHEETVLPSSLNKNLVTQDLRIIDCEPEITGHKPSQTKAVDLEKVLAESLALAKRGAGTIPPHATAVPIASHLRQQFSFSRITGDLSGPGFPNATTETSPGTSGKTIDSQLFGSYIHAVLEQVLTHGEAPASDAAHNAPTPNKTKTIAQICHDLASRFFSLSHQETIQEASDLITRFSNTKRAAAIRAATELHHELEFMLAWPADAGESTETRFFQGFFDCLYLDTHGDWHLIDYKSNNLTAEKIPQEAEEKYRLQMFLYASALHASFGVWPVETTLHFLRTGVEYQFNWSETDRREMTEEINSSIQKLLDTTR